MFKQPKHPCIAQLPSMQYLSLGFHHPPQRIHTVFAIGISPPTPKDPYPHVLPCFKLPLGFHHPPQRIHTVFAIGVLPPTPKDPYSHVPRGRHRGIASLVFSHRGSASQRISAARTRIQDFCIASHRRFVFSTHRCSHRIASRIARYGPLRSRIITTHPKGFNYTLVKAQYNTGQQHKNKIRIWFPLK